MTGSRWYEMAFFSCEKSKNGIEKCKNDKKVLKNLAEWRRCSIFAVQFRKIVPFSGLPFLCDYGRFFFCDYGRFFFVWLRVVLFFVNTGGSCFVITGGSFVWLRWLFVIWKRLVFAKMMTSRLLEVFLCVGRADFKLNQVFRCCKSGLYSGITY